MEGFDAGAASRDERIAELQAELAALEEVREWREKTKHLCGCSYDGPGEVCMVHAPKVQKLEAELAALRAEVARQHALTVAETLQAVAAIVGELEGDCHDGNIDPQIAVDAILAIDPTAIAEEGRIIVLARMAEAKLWKIHQDNTLFAWGARRVAELESKLAAFDAKEPNP